MRVRSVAALFVAFALILAACSDDDDGGGEDTTGPPSTDEIIDLEDQPGDQDAAGAIDDVGELTCKAGGDGWQAAAEVTNSTEVVVSYRIFVSFLDQENDTLGVTQVDVNRVEPGETESWDAALAVSGEDLDCVLRVERFEG